MKNDKVLKIVLIVLGILGIFLLAYFLFIGKDSLDNDVSCESKSGIWVESFHDCDNLSENVCNSIGGTYVEYPDACRDSKEENIMCAQTITITCSLN